ncbi:hypothetical protein D3C86_2012240 [compost metagenome]
MDLADDDLVLARHLIDRQHRAQVVVGAVVVPVAQRAVGLGFAQLAARVAGVSGMRAVDRYPEGDTAVAIAAKVLAVITVVQARGFDGGGGWVGGNREVPGGEIEHD